MEERRFILNPRPSSQYADETPKVLKVVTAAQGCSSAQCVKNNNVFTM